MIRRLIQGSALGLALLLVPSASATAQSHPLVGTWKIEFVAVMRVENGTPTPITGTGTLTVTSEGDSLVSVLDTDPIEGMPPRPRARFAAKRTDGAVTFEQRSEARLNLNGEVSVRTAISEWTLLVNGDQLSGTLARRIEGVEIPGVGPQPLKGTRAKS